MTAPHMLPMQMQPSLLYTGASTSPLASSTTTTYPPAPDVRLLPKTKTSFETPRGLTRPRPRPGSFSTQHHGNIGINSLLKENQGGNEDDTSAMISQRVYTKSPSLKVDCHVFSPATKNRESQPITPSPDSHGWKVPSIIPASNNNDGMDTSNNESGIQGSLGHRVHKIVHSQSPLSTPSSFHSSRLFPPRFGASNAQSAGSGNNSPDYGGKRVNGGHMSMTTVTFDPSPLDPFGTLNRTSHSMYATSDDDEDMANMTQNSPELMLDFECNFEAEGEGINGRSQLHNTPGSGRDGGTPPGRFHLPRAALHRCASWSPGSKTLQRHKDGYNDGLDNSQRLRSFNMDPVASQLLRACVVHEEEQYGTHDQDPTSLSSHPIGRMSDDAALCHSPIPPSGNGNFAYSASMPDLLSPTRSTSRHDRGGSKDVPMISEEASINYPMSPVPLFRDVSDSLLDVKTEDDIKCLPRPVPRKFMPAIASSPFRGSSLPRHL